MQFRRFEPSVRSLAEGSAPRRGFLQGLAGLALAGGVSNLALGDDAEARKRKKKRKKKRRNGNGGNACQRTLCNGQCVDLASNPDNCGSCDRSCEGGETCVEGQCVAIFGGQGNGVGQFQDPTGIALNAEGDAFVTDTGNARLVTLEGGEFDQANFAQPGPVAISLNSGRFFVTDLTFQRVVRLDNDGTFLSSFGGQDDEEGAFQNPVGVAVDQATGQVYVADTGNSRIQHFNANGQPLGLFGLEGTGQGQLSFPRGVAVNSRREVIVADSANNRIQVFARRVVEDDFVFVRAFGSEGSGEGQFSTPTAVAVDRDDNIYVADLDNHRVQQFTSDGQFVTAFGRRGGAPGEFEGPTAITIDQTGVIFVVDRGNHRVQRFRPPGKGVKAGKRRAPRTGRDSSRA